MTSLGELHYLHESSILQEYTIFHEQNAFERKLNGLNFRNLKQSPRFVFVSFEISVAVQE
jgi:hypothetical protein